MSTPKEAPRTSSPHGGALSAGSSPLGGAGGPSTPGDVAALRRENQVLRARVQQFQHDVHIEQGLFQCYTVLRSFQLSVSFSTRANGAYVVSKFCCCRHGFNPATQTQQH